MIGIGVCTRLLPGDPRGPFFMGMTADYERILKNKDHERIQQHFKREFSPDDYSIRGAWVINSRRDYYFSRFKPGEAHEEVAELIVGAPKMGAHQYGTLPMGLTYDAIVKKRSDPEATRWPERDRIVVETKYIIPNDDWGTPVTRRIDMGIWREVSLGWRCAGAECSICHEHIYSCPHVPGDIYRAGGLCEFEFSGITNVLEDSFVFRGGQKGTTTFIPEGADNAAAAVAGAASRLMRLTDGDVAWDDIATRKRTAAPDFQKMPNRIRAMVAQYARAQGFGLMCAEPGERTNTQALLCSRERFLDVKEAAQFVREHDFRADRRRTTAKNYVFEQFGEGVAEKGTFEDLGIDEGVVARICKRAPKAESADGRGRDLSEWLAGART